MPKNTVNDPITDQEIAFAHLVLSGTMNDRAAAEAAGLNPDTAAYTKSKLRVRDYMIEHRNAVTQKLIDQEVEGLRKLNLGRDQVLARLWELANLSHEVTRGFIAGQVKAISLIVAIEGLIPSGTMNDRRLASSAGAQPAAPPAALPIPGPEPTTEPALKLANDTSFPNTSFPNTSFPNLPRPQSSPINPFINPEKLNPFPAATDLVFDAVLDKTSSLRLSLSPEQGLSGRRR
jgi:hypothetical protein